MAALTTQTIGNGGAYTLAAAAGGGDTVEAGSAAGGWASSSVLLAAVGGTATTITVGGTAYGPFTSQNVAILVNQGYMGARVAVTYNQVVGVTVGVIRSAALTGVTLA